MRLIYRTLITLVLLFMGCDQSTDGKIEKIVENQTNHRLNTTEQSISNNLSYVGIKICNDCHQKEMALFNHSHHDLAMQHVDMDSVLGNFNNASFTYNNITSKFFQRDGKFLVNTDGKNGILEDFEVKYTFGVKPLQQYLIEFSDGRIQVLSIAWDTRSKQQGGQHWFHLYPDEDIDYKDELHWTGVNQNWNYMCAECHSTGLDKNYDPGSNTYQTSWAEIDVSCEACHGPGSSHVELARNLSSKELNKITGKGLTVDIRDGLKGNWIFRNDAPIASLDGPKNKNISIQICARCHSRRTTIDSKDLYKKNLHDTHIISLLEPGLYHADGQINDEVYVYGSFLQSKMYASGVSCNDCHEPHSAQLRIEGNGLCLQCHKQEAYDNERHHFHKAGTEASNCITCHMQTKTYMVIDVRHDHSFRVPRPDLSIKTGSPNVCNQCHTNESPLWAGETIMKWYGKESFNFNFGEAFYAARNDGADAEKLLLIVVNDKSQSTIVRATALAQLSNYLSPKSIQPIRDGLLSTDAMVRSASVNALAFLNINDRLQLAGGLLNDPVKTVRINAARLLAPLQNEDLPQQQKRQLDKTIMEYIEAQRENSDRAYSHVNLGNLYADMRQYQQAESAYKKAIQLETNFVPAYNNLADLYRLLDMDEQAESVLRQALKINPQAAMLYHALGLALVRQKKYADALINLKTATQIATDNSRFNMVYAIALNSQGNTAEAIDILSSSYRKHPDNPELIMTLATIHRDDKNMQTALFYAERLVEVSPDNDRQARQLLNSLREKLERE